MDLHVGRSLSRSEIASLLAEARQRTLLLVGGLTDEELRLQHDKLMSPIVWDLGHIAHFEEVWLLEHTRTEGGASEGLRGIYNPFENPRATRDGLPLPSLPECRDAMARIRRDVLDRLAELDIEGGGGLLKNGFVFRLVLQHEYQHDETILQTLQLKQGRPYLAPRALAAPACPDPASPPRGSMVRFPGGTVELGTNDRTTAYDNERPRHAAEVAPFWLDVHPVTNGEFLRFVEAGGYDRREVWAPEGWAWRQDSGVSAPKHWERRSTGWYFRAFDREGPLDPSLPVCHVCFWEADAYARWADKRLPTELEWETAATWDPETGGKRTYPWGNEPPTALHANLDAQLFQAAPVGSYPLGVSPIGCWGMIGDVWEWTSTDFHGYPGFRSYPYPEYSEVFFGDEYKVLRGGSWATRTGAIRGTFRNWDYPIRRQIFAGLRCARDA